MKNIAIIILSLLIFCCSTDVKEESSLETNENISTLVNKIIFGNKSSLITKLVFTTKNDFVLYDLLEEGNIKNSGKIEIPAPLFTNINYTIEILCRETCSVHIDVVGVHQLKEIGLSSIIEYYLPIILNRIDI